MREQVLQAIRLAESGRTVEALRILRDVLRHDPRQEAAWRWLAYLTPDPAEAHIAVRHVLHADPSDAWAHQALAILEGRSPAQTGYTTPIAAHPPRAGQQTAYAPSAQRKARPAGCATAPVLAGLLAITLGAVLAVATLLIWRELQADPDSVSAITPAEQVAPAEPVDANAPAAPLAPTPTQFVPPTPTEPDPTTPASTEPEVRVTTQTTTYTFQAETISQIQTALYTLGPRMDNGEASIAMTTYRMWVEWKAIQSPNSCQIADAVVNVDIVYTYPEWQPTGSPSEDVYNEWERFMLHVIAHEEHHGAIAVDCAHELAAQIGALAPQSSCEANNSQINTTVDTVYAQCEERQAEYDRVEGRTSFPLP